MVGGTERLPLVGIVAGALLALLAVLLSLASNNVLKTARYDDCRRQASAITQRLHVAVEDRLQRVAAGEVPAEVQGVWALGAEGVLGGGRPGAPKPPAELLAAGQGGGEDPRAINVGTLVATWLPASRLERPLPAGARGVLVHWDVDAVRASVFEPLLESGGVDDYRVVLVEGDSLPQGIGFRPRGFSRPAPPFAFWRVGVGLVDGGATRRALRIQTRALAGLSAWLFLVLVGSLGLYVKRERERERGRKAREQFLTRATHELQTPLALMRAAAETIKRGAAERPQDVARCADIVLREDERLTRTVRRLLRYLRLESAGQAMAERASLRDEVERICADHGSALEGQGLTVEARLADFPPALQAPRDLVGDTLAELLANARKHARGGTRVVVQLEALGPGRARLTVTDDGPGLAAGLDPERVFAPWTGGETADAQRGSGLGLALLREGLQQIGGSIVCAPATGGGARFVVEVPVEVA